MGADESDQLSPVAAPVCQLRIGFVLGGGRIRFSVESGERRKEGKNASPRSVGRRRTPRECEEVGGQQRAGQRGEMQSSNCAHRQHAAGGR